MKDGFLDDLSGFEEDRVKLKRTLSLTSGHSSRSNHRSRGGNKYGYSELTPIFIFDKTPKNSSQTVSYHTLPSGGYSQVKSQRMEIKFGISGMLKPQKDKKEKSSSKTSTLKRKWSLKFPKLDKRDQIRSDTKPQDHTDKSDHQRINNSFNNKLDVEEEMQETSYDRDKNVLDITKQNRPWVTRKETWDLVEPNLDYDTVDSGGGSLGNYFHDDYLDGDISTNGRNPNFSLDFQEIYQAPMYEKFDTQAEIYRNDDTDTFNDESTDFTDERFTSEEREPYENIQNYNDTTDDDGYDHVPEPTFEDLNHFIDSLTLKVNELEFGNEESEDIDSKESTDSVNFSVEIPEAARNKRSGSILKHPGQKRTHIKHVEFLDVIADDKQNGDNVRYF